MQLEDKKQRQACKVKKNRDKRAIGSQNKSSFANGPTNYGLYMYFLSVSIKDNYV